MAYEPKTWETGEVITASGLNHMENGIGAFYITATRDGNNNITLSASYNDIIGAISAGKTVLCVEESTTPSGVMLVVSTLLGTMSAEQGCMAIFYGISPSQAQPSVINYTATDADSPLGYIPDVG